MTKFRVEATDIKPLYNQVLLRPLEVDFTSKGGIIIQEVDTRAVNMRFATVVAVGPGMITPEGGLMPLSVKAGDMVMFIRGSGTLVKYSPDCEELFMLKEQDLYGIIGGNASLEQTAKRIASSE